MVLVVLAVILFPLTSLADEEAVKASSDTLDDSKDCPPYHFCIPANTTDTSTRYNRPEEGYVKQVCGAKSKHIKDNWSISLESGFRSQYIWRGLESSTGAVWQPSFNVGVYGFAFNVWANMPLSDEPDQGQINEIDFVPSYNFVWKGLTVTPAFEYYIYPGTDVRSLDYSPNSTVRTALHLSYNFLNYWNIFGNGELDLHQAKGALYFSFGGGFHYRIFEQVKFDTSVLLGVGDGRYNKHHMADAGTQLDLFEWSVSFSVNPWKGLVLKPNAHISSIVAKQLRDSVNKPVKIFGGLDVIYNF